MHIEWTLIIFTTLIAWSAGLFASQAILAFKGKAKDSQMLSWVISAVLLIIGGIAVFFHLQHWERIFNGFGHLSSGITQEFIGIVILGIVALLYLIMMRKSEDGKSTPKWLCIVAVIVCAALVCITAHSYMMTARPAWDSLMWLLFMIGSACSLGPITLALIMAIKNDSLNLIGMLALIGSLIGLVGCVAYAIQLQIVPSSFVNIPYHFDSTNPTKPLVDVAASVAAAMPLIWGVGVLLGGILPAIMVFLAKKKGESKNWKIFAGVAIISAFAGTIALKVCFFQIGYSVVPLF